MISAITLILVPLTYCFWMVLSLMFHGSSLWCRIWGGLPPPDVLYRISTVSSAEKCLHNNYLKSPKNSSVLTLITLHSAFEHISFIFSDAYN